ncbi:copper amine oxidase N-terminal domain-containing protein [Paenibacillus turpanensis]|uniref:copper amine oxidase N-terminal domain-containing protein n=1 Tax=Paenibacillus turpanensis TaxID=2689078 RepID=UPI001409D7C7|nr:copper amine oxidase N-terminal domain-containing protein [Paenibacillus turpanensis]
MKKWFMLLTAIMLIWTAVPAQAAQEIKVTVNDSPVIFPDAKPFLDENERTMIPVRFVSEKLGAIVDWDGEQGLATIRLGLDTILLTLNNPTITINGEAHQMDTMPIFHETRTFVPLRFVSEALGAKVEWDETSYTVNITTDESIAHADIEDLEGQEGMVEFSIHINYLKPVENQYKEVEIFLNKKVGEEITKEVMDFVKANSDWRNEKQEIKYIDWDSKKIQIITQGNDPLTSIQAW